MARVDSNSDEPLILAVETSGRMGSVALGQGEKLLGEQSFSEPMRHSEEIFPAVVGLLERVAKKPADIEQVHISNGPGSFTGLRIAVTLAKTVALTNKAKIVAVDTLDCIAANVIEGDCNTNLKLDERLATILDAKRGQFFVAVYEKADDAGWQKILPDCLVTADDFLHSFAGCGKPIALLGEGLVYYKDKFEDPAVRFLDEKFWNPTAANIHQLGWSMAKRGQFADVLTLAPNYLRRPLD